MSFNGNPLVDGPPATVALLENPLELVLAQLRFPVMTQIAKSEYMVSFQEAVRQNYPVLRHSTENSIVIQSDGSSTAQSVPVWRFADSLDQWRLTLTPDFLTLETNSYTNRDEFVGRFRDALTAFQEHFGLTHYDRFGVRFVNRFVVSDASELVDLVRPEVSGVLATPFQSQVQHYFHQFVAVLPGLDAQMSVRWAFLPPNMALDSSVPPVQESNTWTLDLDVFRERAAQVYSQEEIIVQTKAFTDRIYAFFRWAVTEEFLQHFGGQP